MKTIINRYGKTILVIAGLILFYEILTDGTHILNSVVFPGVGKVARAYVRSFPELCRGLQSSLNKLVPAYLLALVIGISSGLYIGQRENLRMTLAPIFNGLSPIPATLLTTYAITVFPTFLAASRFIIFIGCLWPILNGTISGVTLIEKNYLDSARTLELKGLVLTLKVILPGALPTVLNGAKTALNASFLLLIVAEMFGSSSGLGYFVQYYTDFSKFDKVLAGILYMSLFIILVMQAFEMLRAYLLRWRK